MQSPKLLIAIACLFSAYFVTARFGFNINSVQGFAAFVWLPSGISLASLTLYGYGLWPAVAFGALASYLSIGASPLAAAFIVVGDTLQAVIGARLLRTIVQTEYTFVRLRDAAGFIGIAISVSMITAIVGPLGLLVGQNISAGSFWQIASTWWIGNSLGILVTAPVILTWLTPNHLLKHIVPLTERVLFIFLLIAIDSFVFMTNYGTQHRFVAYLALFPLIWSTLRFGSRGRTAAIFLTAAIATTATILGRGPFHNLDDSMALFAVQTFVATITITFLLFGSVTEELVRAKEDLEEYVDRLEHALQENREGKSNNLPETELTRL